MTDDSNNFAEEEENDYAEAEDGDEDEVVSAVLTDVDIPFTSLVFFLVKLSLAAIPATIILTVVVVALLAALGLLIGLLQIAIGPRF